MNAMLGILPRSWEATLGLIQRFLQKNRITRLICTNAWWSGLAVCSKSNDTDGCGKCCSVENVRTMWQWETSFVECNLPCNRRCFPPFCAPTCYAEGNHRQETERKFSVVVGNAFVRKRELIRGHWSCLDLGGDPEHGTKPGWGLQKQLHLCWPPNRPGCSYEWQLLLHHNCSFVILSWHFQLVWIVIWGSIQQVAWDQGFLHDKRKCCSWRTNRAWLVCVVTGPGSDQDHVPPAEHGPTISGLCSYLLPGGYMVQE